MSDSKIVVSRDVIQKFLKDNFVRERINSVVATKDFERFASGDSRWNFSKTDFLYDMSINNQECFLRKYTEKLCQELAPGSMIAEDKLYALFIMYFEKDSEYMFTDAPMMTKINGTGYGNTYDLQYDLNKELEKVGVDEKLDFYQDDFMGDVLKAFNALSGEALEIEEIYIEEY